MNLAVWVSGKSVERELASALAGGGRGFGEAPTSQQPL